MKTHIRRVGQVNLNSNYCETACGQTNVPAGYVVDTLQFRNAVVAEYGGDNRRRSLHSRSHLCGKCVVIARAKA